MKRVLFVDDEPRVLSGLRRMLMRQRDSWDMSFVESGEAALEQLETGNAFNVVISDMRMPQMQGYELLRQIAERSPGTSRIILSGHAKHEAAVRAAGVAHQFIAKPCDADQIVASIQRTCDMRDRLGDSVLVDAVSGLGSIPVLPESYRQLNDEMHAEEPSIDRVAKIISSDIAMSAKVLQLVNSSYFSLPRQIESIHHAAMLLGIDTIKDLVVSMLVFNAFDPKASGLDADLLWRRSEMTSQVSAIIAEALEIDSITTAELRIAGFVHDVGQLALAALKPDEYGEILGTIGCSAEFARKEIEAFGVDHGAIGAYILGVWGLPETIVESTFHHNAREGYPAPEIAITAVASHLVEYSLSGVATWDPREEVAFAPLELEPDRWIEKVVQILPAIDEESSSHE